MYAPNVSPHPQDAAPLKLRPEDFDALQLVYVVSPHPQDAAPLKRMKEGDCQRWHKHWSHRIPKMRPL